MACDKADYAGGVLEIDLAGIVENWCFLSRKVSPASCAAVVKADAYGLGAFAVATALAAAGCRRFFVATLDEALALRGALPDQVEIAVLNGPPPGSASDFVEHALVPVLNDPGQISAWEQAAARQSKLPAMLHVDTGMARLGLSLREFERLTDVLVRPGAICWRALISHLACADAPSHPLNFEQRASFAVARNRLGTMPASLAASSGIFLGRDFHFDFVRPGAALYGVNPRAGAPNPMQQIVRLNARILQIREVDAG